MTTLDPYIEFHSRPGNCSGWLYVKDGKARITGWWTPDWWTTRSVNPGLGGGTRVRVFTAQIGESTIKLTDLCRTWAGVASC